MPGKVANVRFVVRSGFARCALAMDLYLSYSPRLLRICVPVRLFAGQLIRMTEKWARWGLYLTAVLSQYES